MEYRHLGKTGLKVSELCLGAMTFGREATEADSHAMLDRYAAAGGTPPSRPRLSVRDPWTSSATTWDASAGS
jgi:hypothetical protein